MTDNIITLKFGDDSKPSISTSVTPKTPEQSRCKHPAITVDEQYRIIKCNRCGCNVDAFDHLLESAIWGHSANCVLPRCSRAVVAAQLGDEVDIPDELVEGV